MYGTVERIEWLTPHLVRVLFGGEGLDGLAVEAGLDRRVRQPAVRAAGGAVRRAVQRGRGAVAGSAGCGRSRAATRSAYERRRSGLRASIWALERSAYAALVGVGMRNGVACPRCRTLPDRSADELFLLCRGCWPSWFVDREQLDQEVAGSRSPPMSRLVAPAKSYLSPYGRE